MCNDKSLSHHIYVLPFLQTSFLSMCIPCTAGEDDQTYVNWMLLKKGPPQRCECGHFFQLIEAKSTKV